MASERKTNAAHRQLAAITLWGEQWRQHAPSFDAAWVEAMAEPTPATAHRFSPLLLGIARRYAAAESAAYERGRLAERERCVAMVRDRANEHDTKADRLLAHVAGNPSVIPQASNERQEARRLYALAKRMEESA